MSAREPIPAVWKGLPVVDAAAMRALDFDATARFGIPASELMENAGRAVARETLAFLHARGVAPAQARVVVVCGRGSNGGDGLVAARHLHASGTATSVFLCPPRKGGEYPQLVGDTRARALAAGVEIREIGPRAGLAEALARCHAIIDALLGTGASGRPAGAIHHAVVEIVRSGKPTVSVDVPTGVNADTGHSEGAHVKATLTLMLGLPKRGLLAPHARPFVGALQVIDVGYPAELIGPRS